MRRVTYAEELAEFLRCELMTFISLRSFADESYGKDGVEHTPWYVIAGYFGSPAQWRRFERSWLKTVAKEKIGSIGFHANRCIRGVGEYKDIAEDKRERVQLGLIEALHVSSVTGVVAAIDMKVYASLREEFGKRLAKDVQKFNNPYLLAFHQYIQMICKIDRTNRRIGFTFHRRPKGALGSTPEWYDALQKPNKRITQFFRDRLGPFAWDCPARAVALDASDMLAYCAYRHLCADHTPWQWEALNTATTIVNFAMTQEVWDKSLHYIDEFGVEDFHEKQKRREERALRQLRQRDHATALGVERGSSGTRARVQDGNGEEPAQTRPEAEES